MIGVFVLVVDGHGVASQWRFPHLLHGKGGELTMLVSLGSVVRVGQDLDQCPTCPQLKHAPGVVDDAVTAFAFGPGADCLPCLLTLNSSFNTRQTVLTILC